MNNIILYLTNEHIFLFYRFACLRNILDDQNWRKNRALNTVLLIFTAIIGVYFARLQGVQTIKSGLNSLYKNETPIYEIISGASIAFGIVTNCTWLYRFNWFYFIVSINKKFLFKFIVKNIKR